MGQPQSPRCISIVSASIDQSCNLIEIGRVPSILRKVAVDIVQSKIICQYIKHIDGENLRDRFYLSKQWQDDDIK